MQKDFCNQQRIAVSVFDAFRFYQRDNQRIAEWNDLADAESQYQHQRHVKRHYNVLHECLDDGFGQPLRICDGDPVDVADGVTDDIPNALCERIRLGLGVAERDRHRVSDQLEVRL